MSRKDGIRTLADLQSRCRVDEETGCLVFIGPAAPSSSDVWLPGIGAMSIRKAMRILALGPNTEGQIWAPVRCLNKHCCNPKHYQLIDPGEYMSKLRPKLKPDHRARIAVGVRIARGKIGAAQAEEIRTANATCDELAELHQVDRSTISSIRRCVTWKPTVAGASVFSWSPK